MVDGGTVGFGIVNNWDLANPTFWILVDFLDLERSAALLRDF